MPTELIVALDVPSAAELPGLLNRLPESLRLYKVGLELFSADGPAVLEPFKSRGLRVFLDLKLHDIPRTVARAVAAVGMHDVELLTLHAGGGPAMLKAAVSAAAELGEKRPKLLAVTTLTSLDQEDLTLMGVTRSLKEQTFALGKMAIECGVDGLVKSRGRICFQRDFQRVSCTHFSHHQFSSFKYFIIRAF